MADNNQKDTSELKKQIGMIAIYILLGALCVAVFGFVIEMILDNIGNIFEDKPLNISITYFQKAETWVLGLVATGIAAAMIFIKFMDSSTPGNSIFKNNSKADVDSVLENSRFMTYKERDFNFPYFNYETINQLKNDGVPMRAVIDHKGRLVGNVMCGVHSLIIGATGSGKTTTFINPMIQILAASEKGSSMIMTDPKGELLDMHSKFLTEKGYKVKVLDLRDTYSSSRWNPLSSIWDMYQEYIDAGKGLIAHKDSFSNYELEAVDGNIPKDGELWIEYKGKAYADVTLCRDEVSVRRQKIYDEMYEDLNDFISVLCPITNEKDPLWEKGARSIILATVLAMLEDSENPELKMTKQKFNFFNVNKILTNSKDDYAELKAYFEGRDKMSQSYTLSRQVLGAATQTLSSYMSITFDKLNIFNDRGICGLTSATDIDPAQFAKEPTALFMKIPDEKDTRHGLAAIFVLCIYKALIKEASLREDLSLPRNVYFILDEFGNMPKIEKFDKMITVGRSRKIWFNMVLQSYAQLNTVYGEQVANIIKSNCAMKMFIGSNDIGTCKEFSELCGNKTVKTNSASGSTAGKMGEVNISTQVQVRPLIYPSDLQKLNNKVSTGNAIIVTIGNYPLKTMYTPSYKCNYYKFGKMDMADIRSHVFRADEVFYDIAERNKKVNKA